MKTRNLNYWTDPGHGWLAVDRADLEALGIADRVSPYSYQRAGRVYLEEDCDMPLYLDAAKAAGWRVTFTEKHEDPTPIREFSRFKL